ncbi:hypothetical protein NBRC110019_18980 [Neptunitalea chrysea]|uniref:Tetratricopeptide repeat protein n=1 Tax=Neptunitalea chrysea TaxID=1647581 RepID=A0A9W6B8J4_9FLAO|nr:hypothetical protein [Neptunitalea chrysea]GLB52858.1 hypothetical protein NBRC110019_18980 [Neptunitalea chrysea]
MHKFSSVILLGLTFCLWVSIGNAQNENDDASVTSETVESDFQEHFFTALKERAIENYGKAIDELLLCKELDPENAAVDYEMGINYTSARLYEDAENALLAAVEKEPSNRWYSEALFNVYKAQNKIEEAIETAENLAQYKDAFKESLVYLYANNFQYDKALAQLDTLDELYGSSSERDKKRAHFKAMQKHNAEISEDVEKVTEATDAVDGEETDPLKDIRNELTNLQEANDFATLKEKAQEALASYPTQPFLYYMEGVANEHMTQFKQAIESYEMAIEFLVDDVVLEKELYLALANCHKQLGNIQEQQEYLHKANDI